MIHNLAVIAEYLLVIIAVGHSIVTHRRAVKSLKTTYEASLSLRESCHGQLKLMADHLENAPFYYHTNTPSGICNCSGCIWLRESKQLVAIVRRLPEDSHD